MGWHTRHASTLSGLEGHLRPETLNLTAWIHAQGLYNRKKYRRQRYFLFTITFFDLCLRHSLAFGLSGSNIAIFRRARAHLKVSVSDRWNKRQ